MVPLLLLLAFATRSTTSFPPKPPATRVVTACLAVTRSDVQFALGRAVGPGQEGSSGNESTCDYATDRGQVSVTVQQLQQEVDIKAETAALLREIECSSARPAPNLGAQAFFLDIPGAGTQLHVIRGRDYLLVSILGFGEAWQMSGAAESLARTALRRM